MWGRSIPQSVSDRPASPVAATLPLGPLVDEHGAEDDDADDHLLPELGDVQQHEAVVDRDDDQHPAKRADQVADAAEQRDATDHHAGDGEQQRLGPAVPLPAPVAT